MTITDEEFQDLVKAGQIAHDVLLRAAERIKPELAIADLYDFIVTTICKQADLAFPPNISLNEVAAHDTAAIDELRRIPATGLVKIDLGVSVNSMLVDTAKTVSIDGQHMDLIQAAEEALKNAIALAKNGTKTTDIGRIIQNTIESYGFRPISNLTGHRITKGRLHAGITIPNVGMMLDVKRTKLQSGMIIAIEPFSTVGTTGVVQNISDSAQIFSAIESPRTSIGRILFNRFHLLPFSLRDANHLLVSQNITISARELEQSLKKDSFYYYSPLIETSYGLVAQAEHTIYITQNGAQILT